MSLWQFKSTPHPHKQLVHGQPVQVIKDVLVLRVLEDGEYRQVGYCGHQAGRPLSLLQEYPEDFVRAAEAWVTEHHGRPSGVVMVTGLTQTESEEE